MGGSSSKLWRTLQAGDEETIMKMIRNRPQMRQLIASKLNEPLDDDGNTVLHLACRHAMVSLVQYCMEELNANPNLTNARRCTSLHMVCHPTGMPKPNYNQEQQDEARSLCLALLLKYEPKDQDKGDQDKDGDDSTQGSMNQNDRLGQGSLAEDIPLQRISPMVNRASPFLCDPFQQEGHVNVNAIDKHGNTALHIAAKHGLTKCVRALLDHRPPCNVYQENDTGETACDLAERKQHCHIAEALEIRMVFGVPGDGHDHRLALRTASGGTSMMSQWYGDDGKELDESWYKGMNPQELQECKDRMLIEISQMLHISLLKCEALLRAFEWNKDALMEAWIEEPNLCMNRAGIQAEYGTTSDDEQAGEKRDGEKASKENETGIDNAAGQERDDDPQPGPSNIQRPSKDQILTDIFGEGHTCEICSFEISEADQLLSIPCRHEFCRSCWKTYLEIKIQEGDGHCIMCPAFGCSHLVPTDVIEKIVSPILVKRHFQLDLNAFVESNPNMKWCPSPGCGRAVMLLRQPPGLVDPNDDTKALVEASSSLLSVVPPCSHAVDCGAGHYFCWECQGVAHAPCHCKLWEEWHQKITQVKPDEIKQTFARTEDAANCLWLLRNSKQCPRCRSHIQKNDGCNHLKCTKCKMEFCWICLEPWKRHNRSTGGYFRCNRNGASQKAEEEARLLKRAAEARNFEMQELRRFVHHYTKFKLNETSYQTESQLIHILIRKQEYMVSRHFMIRTGALPLISTPEPTLPTQANSIEEKAEDETEIQAQIANDNQVQVEGEEDKDLNQFLIKAHQELLRTRRVLAGAAVYGYFLDDFGYGRTVFEYMEDNLQLSCARLSASIDRPRLKIRRSKLIQLTKKIQQKRLKFLETVETGLNPPEITRSRIKHHQMKDTSFRLKAPRKRLPPGLVGYDPVDCIFDRGDDEECEEEEEQVTEAIIRSLEVAGDVEGWIVDSRGRHTNLSAMFNWPDDEEEEDEVVAIEEQIDDAIDSVFPETGAITTSSEPVNEKTEDVASPKCARNSCCKPRAVNPRTGEIHEYCSLRCKNEAKLEAQYSLEHKGPTIKFEQDPMMDVVIAIELSKIQYLKDEERRRQRYLMERTRQRGRDGKSSSFLSSPSESPTPVTTRSTTPYDAHQRSETISSMIDDLIKRLSSGEPKSTTSASCEQELTDECASQSVDIHMVNETAAEKAIKFFLKETPELDLSETGWGHIPRKNVLIAQEILDGPDFDKNMGKTLVSSLVK